MSPLGAATWKRPYTSIYNDNYRYGNSLYSGTLSDIEKKYTDSLSRTQLRSDRPDLAMTTFAGSTLTSSPNPGATSDSVPFRPASQPLPPRDSSYSGSAFESRLNSALHSPYAIGESDILGASAERRARSLENMRARRSADDYPHFSPLPRVVERPDLEKTDEEPRAKRTPKESLTNTSTNAGSATFWKEKCRDLQTQVDELTQSMADTSSRYKNDLVSLKGKLHGDLSDLGNLLEQTSLQSNELQKTVKRQANQLMELRSMYDDLHRQLQDSQEEVASWQRRSQHLRKEMDRLRTEIEEGQRSSNANRI